MSLPCEQSQAAPNRFTGYLVMVDGRETDITTLSREQAIHHLGLCIDRIEQMDGLVELLGGAIKDWRHGRDNADASTAKSG